MGTNNTSEKKVKFLLETDWLYQEPIDFEHKKYVLLNFFQKIDEQLNKNRIYPAFIELSLHLANIQTLIKEKAILYTDKEFKSLDDEVLLKELLVKIPPSLNENENLEIDKIIKYSASKFFEYFNIFKSYWSLVYDGTSISVKRNKKYIRSNMGHMSYFDKATNVIYVWEYTINKTKNPLDENMLNINLIYEGDKKNLTLSQIINNFSSFTEKQKRYSPVFELKTNDIYPLNETLLPIFKRKILSYVFQSIKLEDMKII